MNWRRLLFPISWLYGAGVWLRNKLFDLSLLKSVLYDTPVICVGNLRIGGEGKTPHIEYLIALLKDEFKIGILSRGYKRKSKGFQLATLDSEAADIGDEPLQFTKKFPDIAVAVDADRLLGIARLITEKDTEVVLLDDAFQHRYVKAGLNILLTSYENLYVNDHLLPAGNLREPATGAKRADLIIVSKCPQEVNEADKTNIITQLQPLPKQQVYFTTLVYGKLTPLYSSPMLLPSAGASCLVVTGIANPASLIKECKNQFKEVLHYGFRDHHAFNKYDLKNIRKKLDSMQGTEKFILTTEKDAMRLQAKTLQPYVKNLPLYYIPISIRFLEKEELFNKQVKNYVRSNKRDY
jgi:tetraacyldisaccharide 4'-kinase